MAISLADLTVDNSLEPPRIIIYGPEKIGKTSLAAGIENVVFLKTEEGKGKIKGLIPFRFGEDKKRTVAEHYEEVLECLDFLLRAEHSFQALAIDSVTSLQPLIYDMLCEENDEPDITGKERGSKFGYQKGYELAGDVWRNFVARLDRLRLERDMPIILIAHSTIVKVPATDTPDYDQWDLEIERKHAAGILKKWADCILFCNFEKPIIQTEDQGFGKKKGKPVDTAPKRFIYTERRHSHSGGNRYDMPYQIPFAKNDAWKSVEAAIVGAPE